MRGTVDVGSECVKQQNLAKLDILQQSGWTALKAIFTKACSPKAQKALDIYQVHH